MQLPTWTIQMQWLFTLAIPVACISWTITHEELFKEPREFCIRCSKKRRSILIRKFFYLFTCEYCFSHYISLGMLILTGFRLLFHDWRGYMIAGFGLVWIANLYMAVFSLLRFGIKKEKLQTTVMEERVNTEKLKAITLKRSNN